MNIVVEPMVLKVIVSAFSSPWTLAVIAGLVSVIVPFTCDPLWVQLRVKVPLSVPSYVPDHAPARA